MKNQTDIIELAREFIVRLDNKDCTDCLWIWHPRKKGDRSPDVSGRLLAQALLEREELRQSVVSYWGVEKGQSEHDIPHLKKMMEIGVNEWMEERKTLRNELDNTKDALRIAMEALEQESTLNKGCGYEKDISGDALRQIRSLLPSQS